MAFMLVRSKVRDFNTWKPAYDAHQAVRSDAGLTEKYLLRSADDANEIVILFEVAGSQSSENVCGVRRPA